MTPSIQFSPTISDRVEDLLMPDHGLPIWEIAIWLNIPCTRRISASLRSLQRFGLVLRETKIKQTRNQGGIGYHIWRKAR